MTRDECRRERRRCVPDLVGSGEGWWRYPLDERFLFEFGWRAGGYTNRQSCLIVAEMGFDDCGCRQRAPSEFGSAPPTCCQPCDARRLAHDVMRCAASSRASTPDVYSRDAASLPVHGFSGGAIASSQSGSWEDPRGLGAVCDPSGTACSSPMAARRRTCLRAGSRYRQPPCVAAHLSNGTSSARHHHRRRSALLVTVKPLGAMFRAPAGQGDVTAVSRIDIDDHNAGGIAMPILR